MAQASISWCPILINLVSNERGGLAIYENAIYVNVKQHLQFLWGFQMRPCFLAQDFGLLCCKSKDLRLLSFLFTYPKYLTKNYENVSF